MRAVLYRLLARLSVAGVLLCLLACALAGTGHFTADRVVLMWIVAAATMGCGVFVYAGIRLQLAAMACEHEARTRLIG